MIGNILSYAIGSLFWGFLIALACVGLFLFLIKGWYNNAFLKPASYVIAVVLGLILTYNCTIICGAVSMKSHISNYETLVAETIRTSFSDYDAVVDEATSNEIVQEVVKANPVLYYFIGSGNFQGHKLAELPHAMADTLRSYLNNVILKKVLWSLAFVVIAAFVAIKTIGRGGGASRRHAPGPRRERERVHVPRRRTASRR